ncbi:primosomal replication protein n [mine drainage metagenome]|uniref:Primosomal replication protein n n=1 Tax=mine drainage metagenome TaxID=410659 RepID=A0A1J5S9Z8_9ZZZZ
MLAGSLLELAALRFTPAGIPALNFQIAHASTQSEAGAERQVSCEMACVALGPVAQLLSGARPGDGLRLTGFLSAKSLKSRTPVLHVNAIEFLEGMDHGI